MADDFSPRVRELAGLADDDEARRVATAVLTAFSGYVSGSVARRLAAPLPETLALPLLRTDELAHSGTLDTLYAAVSGSGVADAPAATSAVLRALVEAADPEAVRAAREQLPQELTPLLQTTTREGDTAQAMAAGPIEPDAPNVAGPDREL